MAAVNELAAVVDDVLKLDHLGWGQGAEPSDPDGYLVRPWDERSTGEQ